MDRTQLLTSFFHFREKSKPCTGIYHVALLAAWSEEKYSSRDPRTMRREIFSRREVCKKKGSLRNKSRIQATGVGIASRFRFLHRETWREFHPNPHPRIAQYTFPESPNMPLAVPWKRTKIFCATAKIFIDLMLPVKN